jgi:hypothetical protein
MAVVKPHKMKKQLQMVSQRRFDPCPISRQEMVLRNKEELFRLDDRRSILSRVLQIFHGCEEQNRRGTASNEFLTLGEARSSQSVTLPHMSANRPNLHDATDLETSQPKVATTLKSKEFFPEPLTGNLLRLQTGKRLSTLMHLHLLSCCTASLASCRVGLAICGSGANSLGKLRWFAADTPNFHQTGARLNVLRAVSEVPLITAVLGG